MKRSAEEIVAYLTGELEESVESQLEEALFDGELDGEDLDELSSALVGLRDAAFLGILTVVTAPDDAERLRAHGYRILEYRLEPGVVVEADLSGDFDLLFMEFVVDLEGVTALATEVCDAEGNAFKRVEDIPIPPDRTRLTGYCAMDLAVAGARANPEGMVTRLLSVEPDGERVLGEYRTRAIALPRTE
jgi:hypothetical protein